MNLSFREKVISSFIDLSSFSNNNITTQAPLYWLAQKKYSDWGPVMVLNPNTREYYREGCEFINDKNLINIVNKYLNQKSNEKTIEEICLYKTRLLYYLGIYNTTTNDLLLLNKSNNNEIKDWSKYLIYLEKYVLNPGGFVLNRIDLESINSEKVFYLMKLLLLNSYSQNLGTKNILSIYEYEITNWPKLEDLNSIVFKARVLRYQSAFLYSTERFKELIDLNKSINNLFNISFREDFLEVESLRRLLFYFCTRLFLLKNFEYAYEHVLNLVKIDPYCSAVHTLRGMIEENLGIYALAKSSYQLGYSLGYNEKDFCYMKIKNINDQKIEKNNLNKEIECLWSANKSYNSIKIKKTDILNLIKSSSVYEMYPSFWTFDIDKNENKPFWYKQIKNSFEVLENEKNLFFETCYFQSLQPKNFRYRMTLSALQEIKDLKKIDVKGLEDFSIMDLPSSTWQIEYLKNSLKLISFDLKKSCYLSRVFLYLGLEKDTIKATSWVWNIEKWNIYHSFLGYTSLLLSYRSGNDLNYFENSKTAFLKFPECDETLRLKLMLCIQCGGFFGKKKDIQKVIYWYEKGKKILEKILESDKFKNEEKMIIHSRWYRFSSFIPYLEKNYNLLDKETNLYINLGTKALNQYPSKFTLENMYAVYETRARTAEFLGKNEEAYNWFLKIRNEIDPFDSKVEINLGDMKEKMFDYKISYSHYESAFNKGPPLRDMAIFKMAKLDHDFQRYWQSIFLFSQYQELVLQSKISDNYLFKMFFEIK